MLKIKTETHNSRLLHNGFAWEIAFDHPVRDSCTGCTIPSFTVDVVQIGLMSFLTMQVAKIAGV